MGAPTMGPLKEDRPNSSSHVYISNPTAEKRTLLLYLLYGFTLSLSPFNPLDPLPLI